MSMIPGNTLEKTIAPDGLQVDHLSENTLGHGNRLQGISNPTTYPVLAGDVGERVVGTGTAVSVTTSGWTTVASVTVTAGVWDLSAIVSVVGIASITGAAAGISTTSNGATGHVNGDNQVASLLSGAAGNAGIIIPAWRVSIAAGASYYLTVIAAGANTVANARLSAVRIA